MGCEITDIDWIFFDCFNTLMDETADETGLAPMEQLPVEAGLYPDREAFHADYINWRKRQWQHDWREIHLGDRLQNLLTQRNVQSGIGLSDSVLQTLIADMVTNFEAHYFQLLKLPEGVVEMLDHWHGKVQMGVVSNIHIPHVPEKWLTDFGLRPYFEFVLDSAACGWKKPGLEIYQAAWQLAEITSTQVHRVLFIGDSLRNDVLTPIQLGMQGMYFERPGQPKVAIPDSVPVIKHWQAFR
ncbi:MAG: HAD family hydrolase [Cyanobacteria bacterium J06635_15]